MVEIITAISPQKRNPERVNVYIDGEFGFGMPVKLASNLNIGQKITLREIDEFKKEDAIEKGYLQALNFISYRPRSEAEVARRLEKYEIPDEIAEAVMMRLKQNRYVDDSKFAELWVDNRCEFRPRGAYALRMELRSKGVSEDVISLALTDLDEEGLALKAARKASRRYDRLTNKDFQQKIYGYLSRRGFKYDIISSTLTVLREEVGGGLESKEVMK
jgi:regulatory protein